MTTCLKPYFEFETSQMNWSVYHFCGLFALVDDLLSKVNGRRLERAEYILKNIRNLKMTVNAPVDNDAFIESMVNRAREVAFGDGLSGYLLHEAAVELCQASDLEFDQKWYRFAYYYFLDRANGFKKIER